MDVKVHLKMKCLLQWGLKKTILAYGTRISTKTSGAGKTGNCLCTTFVQNCNFCCKAYDLRMVSSNEKCISLLYNLIKKAQYVLLNFLIM